MGGDKRGDRSPVNKLITFDLDVHQGPRSIHSKHKKVLALDPVLLMDGPRAFYERDSLDEPWRLAGYQQRPDSEPVRIVGARR